MAQDENQDRDYPHQAMATNGEQTTAAPEETSLPSNSHQKKRVLPRRSRQVGRTESGPPAPPRQKEKREVAGTATNMDFLRVNPSRLGSQELHCGGAYQDLVAGIWEYYKPVGYLEGLLTEKIATESIRYSRLLTFKSKMAEGINFFHWIALDQFLRYQGTINRQLFQAMRELERMQERRKADARATDSLNGLGSPGSGTPLLGDDCSHSPEEGERSMEGSESDANIIPPMPQWERIPLIIGAGKDQNSPPSPTGANYGTNPNHSSPVQPPKAARRKDTTPPKLSLADRVTKVLGLPPMENSPEDSSKGKDTGASVEKKASSDDSPAHPKFIEPEDRALFEQVQKSIRDRENRDFDDPEDSS